MNLVGPMALFSSSVILLVVWLLGLPSETIRKSDETNANPKWFFAAGVAGLQIFGFIWYVVACSK